MSIDSNGQFKLATLVDPDMDLSLSNNERRLLHQLAEPGGPLWKILLGMVRYGDGLKDSLASADLDDPAELKAVRKVQATLAATQWTIETFEQGLSLDEEKETKADD